MIAYLFFEAFSATFLIARELKVLKSNLWPAITLGNISFSFYKTLVVTTYALTVADVLFGGPVAFSGGGEVAISVAGVSSPVRSTSLVLGPDLGLGLVFGFDLLLLSAPIQASSTIALAAAACLGVGFR